ncbi:MAG: cytochrome [Acidimicrobiaceae bacterium]|nr:cytochrome [Acidimicrobiaceae bacterium]|tara:strand:+ start:10039 stop:11268 length:1230 start_codon:yes stop_codon:yes gene_type:complete
MSNKVDDEVLRPDRIDDPHPYFQLMRENDPVHWNEKYRAWFIYRYDDVTEALRESRFSSARIQPALDRLSPEQRAERQPTYDVLMDWLVFRDPPDHTRLRKLVSRAFTPRAIESWRLRATQVVDDTLAELSGKESVNLISDFAYPIPAVVIAEIMGVPPNDRDIFKEWSDAVMVLVFGARGLEDRRLKAQHGLMELASYLGDLVKFHRSKPADNIIADLIAAQEGDDRLSDQEIVANLVLFLFGGHETTTNLIGNGVNALLNNPQQLQKYRRDPESLTKSMVEEVLRYDGPSKMEVRTISDDITMRGKTLRKGDMAYLVQHAANRDPEHFEEPDIFDIEREPNHHIGFGFGIHFCLGAALARLEGSIALERLLTCYPDLSADGEDPHWIPTMLSRGMESFPVSLGEARV